MDILNEASCTADMPLLKVSFLCCAVACNLIGVPGPYSFATSYTATTCPVAKKYMLRYIVNIGEATDQILGPSVSSLMNGRDAYKRLARGC